MYGRGHISSTVGATEVNLIPFYEDIAEVLKSVGQIDRVKVYFFMNHVISSMRAHALKSLVDNETHGFP